MTKDAVTCSPDTTLSEAARRMWKRDMGFLVVLRPGDRRAIGVITDRDVCMAAYAQDRRLSEIPVRSAMTRVVHAVKPDASMDDVQAVMRRHQIRRVPVLNGNEELAGVVGLADFARTAMDARCARELTRTVREVTQPRAPSTSVSDPSVPRPSDARSATHSGL
jgi:CBS domain-containing protein